MADFEWVECAFPTTAKVQGETGTLEFRVEGFGTFFEVNVDDVEFCIPGYARTATTAGSFVTADLGPSVAVTFDAVQEGGVTQVYDRNTTGTVPPGMSVQPLESPRYYQVSTTAAVSGEVGVHIVYDDGQLGGNEEDLMLFEFQEGGSGGFWRNITDSVNSTENYIAGRSPSVGTFALVLPAEATSVDERPGNSPFGLSPDIENPFRSGSQVAYTLDRMGHAHVDVLDLQGRLLARIADGEYSAGSHVARWNGRTDSGKACPAGIYFLRLVSNDRYSSRKFVLLR